MTKQVSLKPNLLFYPLRSSANNFPVGIELRPSHLQEAWDLKDLEQEFELWTTLNRSFPWAAEIYPDFPWMEAIFECTIRTTKNGYSLYPLDFTALTKKIEAPEVILSSNPWVDTYFDLLGKVSQWVKDIPLALPCFSGPIHLLATLLGKDILKGLLSADLRKFEKVMDQITSIYISLYQRILDKIKPTPLGYIAGGCFLSSPKPLLVWKDTYWIEFQHLVPIKSMFYEPLMGRIPSTLFLSTPAHALRWLEPCENCIEVFKGIIVEKKEANPPWEDLVPLFRMIQASGKTLIMAGPPEMEDWELAQRDLEPENLMVLFYTTSFSEVRFWSKHLLGKNRRGH